MQGSGTGIPIGTIITWPTSDWQTDMKAAGGKPNNFLECNGQAVDSSKYPKLAKIMANLPNYQGLFLRGYGSQSFAQENGSLNGTTYTLYSSNSIGTIQGDAIRNISGNFGSEVMMGGGNSGSTSPKGVFYAIYAASENHIKSGDFDPGTIRVGIDMSRQVATDTEIRPINTAVVYLIRAK